MIHDIRDIYKFYQTKLGTYVIWSVTRQLPIIKDRLHVGIGYTSPLITANTPFHLHAMLKHHGAVADGANNILIDTDILPFANASIEHITLFHALEHVQDISTFLRELWRVLVDSGGLTVIVPHRLSWWYFINSYNPFASGKGFYKLQINNILKDHCFTLQSSKICLYYPPFFKVSSLKLAHIGERVFTKCHMPFYGLLVLTCKKEVLSREIYAKKKLVFLRPTIEMIK